MKKNVFIGITVIALVLGLSLVSCLTGLRSVDYSLMDNSVSIDKQSYVVVLDRIMLNTIDENSIQDTHERIVNDVGPATVYILPAGMHSFSGDYTYFGIGTVTGATGSYYSVKRPAGRIDFNINYNFLPGQFYYLVGNTDSSLTKPSNILILTEEELRKQKKGTQDFVLLQDARKKATKQIKQKS